MNPFRRLTGLGRNKALKSLAHLVAEVNRWEPLFERFSDADLASKTVEFRDRLKSEATLDNLAPEAFAVVREAARRVLDQRHHDVQVVGAGTLHRGMIAEMKAGERLESHLSLAANGLRSVTLGHWY